MIVCLCFTVAGCSSEPQPSKKTAERRAARKKAKKNKVKTVKPDDAGKTEVTAEPYRYTSLGKADPFVPLLIDLTAGLNAQEDDQNKPFLTPLQKYELSDLTLVAVVVLDGEPTAMLEDPTGYGYVIRAGMLIGPHDGVVDRVVPNGLIVREKFFNDLGESESKISTITIQQVE